jgi:amino acid adenylation domain-containing protein/FkbM family methyltransferase
LCPKGIAGELCIGGAQVAEGYLNRPELTAEKFISDPFSKEKGARLYKTGDLARWLPDGNLEYLGRIDEQVKIRGYRVELGEIESVLQQSGLVSQAVVIAKEDKTGNKQLAGYVVAEAGFDKAAVISWLKARLPEYMVPALWVELEKLPLSPNGKVDRKALPEVDGTEQSSHEYVAPRNETEQKLAEIWQELLGVEKVGIHDNFFELGGHSILAMQTISAVRRKLKLEVSIKDLFVHPTIKDLSGSLAVSNSATILPGIKAINPRPANIPLSFAQERLWFIDKLEGTAAYHMSTALRLKGKLDKEALQFALQKIVDRHEVLRTVIKEEDGEAFQYIHESAGWYLNIVHLSTGSSETSLQAQIQQQADQPFDLSKDYMLRANLITCGAEDYVLVVTMHHVASDGWSLSIVIKEVVELYKSFVEKVPDRLAKLQIQYADYAIWQRTYLQGELIKKTAYWEKQLSGVRPLVLPTDFPRPPVQTTNGDVSEFAIDEVLLQSINSLSQQQGATLFMTLVAAFKVLLYRYSGQSDICVGTPTANRTYNEVEGLIGLFLNTVALRTNVNGDDTFVELLKQVKATTLDAYDNQDVPFEKVVETVVKERDLSRNALFQVMFTLQNTPEVPKIQLGEVGLTSYGFVNRTSKFDLSFSVTESIAGLKGTVHYNTDLFRKDTIQRMLEHFYELLASIVKDPQEKVVSLSILPVKQQQQLLQEFNKPIATGLPYKTLVELFEGQVKATPGNVALVFGGSKLTYQQLNERANELAHHLIEKGVGLETVVPICIDRSFEMMIGILAILKAGGAYTPIDPDYPVDRIQYMVEDINAFIILTSETHAAKVAHSATVASIINIDGDWNKDGLYSFENVDLSIKGNNLAYVLYTSGSTGKPKGVQVEHKSISYHLHWFTNQYRIDTNDSSLLISSFSFDGAMTAIWPVLVRGGSLHLPVEKVPDPTEIVGYISEHSITYIKTLPGIFKEIVNASNFTKRNVCKSIRLIILGGERINANDLKTYISQYPDITFSNHYGPTECTVSSSFYLIDKSNIEEFSRQLVVGKPVDNTNIFIINEAGLLNPVGVPGEISITGTGVSRGYLNDQELTKKKFVTSSIGSQPGVRMYNTGDIGRWLADGNIEYLNRKDDQVKIRGYRVEPGEIEEALKRNLQVSDAVVIAREDTNGDYRLIAYIIPKDELNQEQIAANLRNQLPAFMVPSYFIETDSLPTTPNGKVDRNTLKNRDVYQQQKNEYLAPRNKRERVIAEIWKELLKIGQIGVNENFFEIGGHSLLAMRVVSAIRKQLQVEVAVKALFVYPTIESLASHLNVDETGTVLRPIEVKPRPNIIPLSYTQERLWFVDQLEGGTLNHIPSVLRLKGTLKVEALIFALKTVIERHEVLRTVILSADGKPHQHIRTSDEWKLNIVDGTVFSEDESALQRAIDKLIKAPFNLSKDYMLRADLVRLKEDDHLVVTTMHHIASDGWSTSVLVKEVVELYASYVEGRAAKLESLPIQYADFAIWQRAYLQGELLENKINYWKKKLEGLTQLQLPCDYTRPAIRSTNGSYVSFNIEGSLSNQLQQLSQQQGTTLFMTLLATLKVLLYKYTGQPDITVGTGIAGRQQTQLEGLIGFFVNLLALRTEVNSNSTFSDLLQQVSVTTMEAFEHQDLPFEKVVDAVVEERDMSRSPLFQVLLVMQNTPDTRQLKLRDLELSSQPFINNIAKFDLTFFISEGPAGLKGSIEYNTDLYKEDTIVRMLNHFKHLLTLIAKTPEQQLAQLHLLTSDEENQLLQFNNASVQYRQDNNIISLFEEQVAKKPDAIAVIFKDEQLSYQELNERSNQLAAYLQRKGARVETLVPICVDRSLEMIVGILGILKAGAAYVPIDPDYPADRINFIIEDTGADFIITNSSSVSKFIDAISVDCIELDGYSRLHIENQKRANLNTAIKPHQLAYVIYTSGSTGKPKGVMIEHHSFYNYLLNNKTKYISSNEDSAGTFLHLSYTFDASITSIFMPLISGKSVVVGSKQSVEVFEDSNLWKYAPYAFIKLTPSHLPLLEHSITINNDQWLTDKLVLGGEALRASHFNYLVEKDIDVEIVNEYGPTEATVGCSTYCFRTVSDNEKIKNSNSISIGKPIDNVQIYIVDETNNLVPVGVVGEICIAGEGLSRGYLNRNELSAEKFIANPFGENQKSKLYKTGDLGKWSADGNIEYLGRKDDQVKVRGYRVELGEIESVLSSIAGIKDAKVIVSESEANDSKKLNAYLQVDQQSLPLLANYVSLLNNKAVSKSDLHILPNGLPVLNSNLNEVRFLYNEIFEDHCYLKHGITFSEDSCVVDIGANAGFFTVFLNVLSKDIKVYSIEPIPEVHHYLKVNRELYNIKGKALQVAVLDTEKEVDFTYYPGVSIVSGLSDEIREVKDVVASYIRNSNGEDLLEEEIDSLLNVKLESRQIKVKTKTLSQIIEEEKIDRIDLLKVDVENSEHHVLAGILDKDWDKIGSIIIEVHDVDGRLKDITEILAQRGFKTFVEKEKMLSKDDILYNLFAIKDAEPKAITTLGEVDKLRASEWTLPADFEIAIREEVEQKLPEYMLPANIVLLHQFPLTLNGKIDTKALPPQETNEFATAQSQEHASEVEKTLVEIWKDLLEIDHVGFTDNFFNSGGDSLLVVRLISLIRKEFGAEISITNVFENPTVKGLARLLNISSESEVMPAVEIQQRPQRIPLSFSQERLWFIDQLEGSVKYHIPVVLRLNGVLDEEALQAALQTIVNRHEVLRTVYKEYKGKAYQSVLNKDEWLLNRVNGSGYEQQPEALRQLIEQLINKPFDLAKDHMLRCDLIALAEEESILIAKMHHIASDGWSTSIIVREVVELYEAKVTNRKAELNPLTIQYIDYAIWQRKYLNPEVLDKKINYWKEKLKGIAPLQIPTDYPRNAGQSSKGALAGFELDKELSRQLQDLSQQNEATLFMTLLSAYKVLLYRYSGQTDICVGSSVAGRQQKELEELIGYFLNTLALRSEVSSDLTFTDLLRQVRSTTLEAYENQEVPFEKVVEAVVRQRDNSRTPLFQAVFVLQNLPDVQELRLGHLKLSKETFEQQSSKFDLIFTVAVGESGIQGSVQYAADLFSHSTINRMIDHFKELLSSIAKTPGQKIGALSMLKTNEQEQMLTTVIGTKADYLWDKTIIDLFEEQVLRTPDNIALQFDQEKLTYKELNDRSNQFARFLINSGVEEEMLIPICMDRGINLIVSILSVLKAGCAYVPIDPAYPEERIRFVLEDTRATIALTNEEGKEKVQASKRLEVIVVENIMQEVEEEEKANLQTAIEPNHLAYIIYTSGSTGKPKGVSVMHRGIVNMSSDQIRQFNITQKDKILQFASISFDASVSEIFMALYAGATLVLMRKQAIRDAENFPGYLSSAGVSVVTLPPAYLKVLQLDSLKFLRVLITAGEQADVKHATYLSCFVDYYNAYGPTECSVCVTIYKVMPDDATKERIPIGKPIANTNVYLLDEERQLVHAGLPGEIYVSGIGLAKGYHRSPELTAEKFIANPFGTGKKLYKTGDLGRWLPDGNLEFLGRKDEQVKIRGNRVEPGEVENALLSHPGIESAAVTVSEVKDDKQLVGYYKLKNKIKLWPSVAEFYVYDDLLYKTMASDEARNAKYRRALRKVVKDKVVLEIGPGFEAILSRIAIEEGAKKVYAVELLEDSYNRAKQTVQSLGLQDKIIVIHDDITKVTLPELADYCVSEIVGAIGGSEGSATLINASRRLLKDPVSMIPSRSLTNIAAITFADDEFDCGFEDLGAYYTSKIFEQAGRKFDLRVYLSSFPTKNIISNKEVFEDLDYTQEIKLEDEHDIVLNIKEDSILKGFIVWLNLYCDDEEVIDTVDGKYTWLPIYFPAFFGGEKVSKGDYIKAKIIRKVASNNLNPDFIVEGTLVRKQQNDLPFTYKSSNISDSYRGNEFYAKIFANDDIRLAKKINKDDLKDFVKERLPEFMVPSFLIEVENFPLTISGKIDKKALPEPVLEELLVGRYVAPASHLESQLLDIWKEILEVDEVGVQDDFFELGGHSLLAVRLISAIRKELEVEVAISDVFDNPTVASLAAQLQNKVVPTEVPAIVALERPKHVPLTYSQERLWFIDRLEGSVKYHMPAVLRLSGKLDVAALNFALQTIVSRHEILRTVINEHDGQRYQYVLDEHEWNLNVIDGSKYLEDKTGLDQYVQELINKPYDLSKDYMLRADLISLVGGPEFLLVTNIHHIASDGWSLSILVKELVELYSSSIQGRQFNLDPLSIQYADYAIWQRNYLQGEVFDNKINYWKEKLEAFRHYSYQLILKDLWYKVQRALLEGSILIKSYHRGCRS